MFRPKPAALFLIQLLNVWSVCAELAVADLRDELVSRGDSVVFVCNISMINISLIQWTTDGYFFSFSTSMNRTFSNFSSSRLRIDINIPSTLNISNAQHNDSGLYTCGITSIKGFHNITWNLTVSENPKQRTDGAPLLTHMLLIGFGLLIGFIIIAVCICRKRGARKENPDPDLSQHQTDEHVLTELQGGTNHRRNNKRRTEYTERLNSIYNLV